MNAEQEVLGALLTDCTRLKDITFLSPEMFADGRYGVMYKAFVDGAESASEVVQRLLDAGRNKDLVMKDVQELIDMPIFTVNVVNSARLIRDSYRLREAKKIISGEANVSKIDQYLHETIKGLQELTATDAKVKTAAEIAEEMEGKYFVPKTTNAINTGIKRIDTALCGLDPGDMHIIAARPGVGKSALALQVIKNMIRDGRKVAYYNLEMGNKQVYERLLASESGIELTRIRMATNFLGDESMKFGRAQNRIKQFGDLYVITGSRSVDELRVGAERYDVIVVDYLQLLKSDGRRGANRVAEVGDISHGLKNLATDFNIPLIALSQLNRASEKTADREPLLSDLRESGDLEQDASTVLMLWDLDREDRSRKGLKIAKARQGESVMIELHFDGAHMRFEETDGFKKADKDTPFD